MNEEILKTQRKDNKQITKNVVADMKQAIKNLDTDKSRNELGKEVVDAEILKLKEKIKLIDT